MSKSEGRPCCRGAALIFANEVQVGGDDRDRTGNLGLAKPALSQLSYVPGRMGRRGRGLDPQLGAEAQHAGLPAKAGGLRWTRTTGLVLIRDAL